MSTPLNPLLLRCVDRVVDVLKKIVEGDDYFYTVGEKAVKGLRGYNEAPGYPFDMVYLGADHQAPEYVPDHRVHRYPTIIVAAYVDEEGGEPITKMLKHLADVQRAIETDFRSTDQASLSVLVGWGRLGMVITDEGELGLEGGAGFRLEINLCLVGDWGEI
jgi:hypothetical protein